MTREKSQSIRKSGPTLVRDPTCPTVLACFPFQYLGSYTPENRNELPGLPLCACEPGPRSDMAQLSWAQGAVLTRSTMKSYPLHDDDEGI